ncbi:hypothetical protein V6N11_019129 [Hibiscus sabdariffa]|uniref:Mitochondrial protein n=1 Tax=Hibiscus sabdariffa TaxID=183260 RepID=A0ABR2R1K0_9ROSI
MPSFRAFTTILDAKKIPKNIHEALQDPRWKKVVEEEISALEKTGTWVITDLPTGKNMWAASGSLLLNSNPMGVSNGKRGSVYEDLTLFRGGWRPKERIEVSRSKEGLVINQRKYILDLLKETGLLGCKPVETPMDTNVIFNTTAPSFCNEECFQQIAESLTDRKSTSGYCTLLWGNLVTWRSKKQAVISRSSAEAEIRALAQGMCDGIWLIRLLR